MSNFFLGLILVITAALIEFWYHNVIFAVVLFVLAIVFCDLGKAIHEGIEYAVHRIKQQKVGSVE